MEELSENRQGLRRRVIEVAAKEFKTKGVKSVTMDEVAYLLAMSKRTLYQLFRDKEELLLACMEVNVEREEKYVKELMEKTDNVLEILLHIFRLKMQEIGSFSPAFLPDLKRYPRLVEFIRVRKEHSMAEGMAFMQRGILQGVFKPNVDFRIVCAYLLKNNMDYVVEDEAFRNDSLKEIFLNTVMLVIRGCTTPKGMALLDDFVAEWSGRQDHLE